jgi:hypothetical protein
MDPKKIFESSAYRRSKAIFWPDLWGLACKSESRPAESHHCGQTGWPNHIIYPVLNLTWKSTRSHAQEMETGQFMVDSVLHSDALLFTLKLTADKWVQQVIYGELELTCQHLWENVSISSTATCLTDGCCQVTRMRSG